MESDETRQGKEALSGGHLCHVCGYQYPKPHPSAKLRRSHRKNCRKMPPAVEGGGCLGLDEREEAAGEHNAAKGFLLGGGGGEEEGNGACEANRGSGLRGSAIGDGDLVENKENAEHASPNGAGVQVITSGCAEALINCTNNSFEIANAGNGANLPRASTNGSQNKVAKHCSEIAPLAVGHPAEREDSFDEYQDASPFLHQSDSEDGAAVAHESDFSLEIINMDNLLLGTSVSANEISVEMEGLCKDHLPIEPSTTDFSSGSKVEKEDECCSENKTPGLAEPEDSLKLDSPDECSVNLDSINTDMNDNKSDKTSCHREFIGNFNVSSLQKCSPLISDPESQSTCPRKVEGFKEDSMDILHIMSEISRVSKVVGSDNVESETVTNSGTNFVPTGNELKLIHAKNTSTDCCSFKWPVEDASDQLPLENSCLANLVCSVVGYQNDLAITNVHGLLNSIAKDSSSEGIFVKGSGLEFSCVERPQQDVEQIVNLAGKKQSFEKPNGFSKEEVCNKENDTEFSTKYQVSTSQEHVTLLMDQASCIKNPFNLDDNRSDDLFELATDSYHLEAPDVVESKHQINRTSLTVSNQTSIAQGQHCLISDDRRRAVSSASETGFAVGAEDMSASSSEDPTKNISLHDLVNQCMQEGEAHTSGIIFAPSQVFRTEFSTMPTSQEINAFSTNVEEKMQTEDASAKNMTVAERTDMDEEKMQAEVTIVKEINAILNANNVEEKLTEGTSTETDAAQHMGDVGEKLDEDTGAKEVTAVGSMDNSEEKNQAEDTGANGGSAVRSMENVAEKNQTEDTSAKRNKEFNADNVDDKRQTDDTNTKAINAVQHTINVDENKRAQDTSAKEMNAAQRTDNVKEKKQTEDTIAKEMDVVQSSDNVEEKQQNEEIAARLNSGRIHVPLKVLLAEASVESKEKKPSTKERVLSFRRRASKDDASSVKSGSPKAGSDDQYWNSPAKLPQNNVEKRSKGRRQPWVPFICCHSVH